MDDRTLSVSVGNHALDAPAAKAFGELLMRFADLLDAETAATDTGGKPVHWVILRVHNSVPAAEIAPDWPWDATVEVFTRAMRDLRIVADPRAPDVPGRIGRAIRELRRAVVRHRVVARAEAASEYTELRGEDIAAAGFTRETHEEGILEGTLEAISVHEGRECSIYDPITGDRVRGTFSHDLVSEIGRLIGRRVYVTGVLTYRDARTYSVRIEEIRDLTPNSVRPIEELRGIGRTWFGLEAAEDFIRELWGDDDE